MYYFAVTFSFKRWYGNENKQDSSSDGVKATLNITKWHHIFRFLGYKRILIEV
jgi:hypothetical protein